MFNIEKQAFSTLSRAEIFVDFLIFRKYAYISLMIGLHFIIKKIELRVYKKNWKWKNFSIHLPKEYEVKRGLEW